MPEIIILSENVADSQGLALVMQFAGHRCREASSLDEAVQMQQREPAELILADPVVAGKSSAEILDAFRVLKPKPSVMILTEDAPGEFLCDQQDDVCTVSTSPVHGITTRFAPIERQNALLVLLPEKASLSMQSGIPRSPAMLNRLAVLYHAQRKFEAAEQLYRQALKFCEKQTEMSRSSVAAILFNLAKLYMDQWRFHDALPLLKLSLAVVEKEHGEHHPKVAPRLEVMAFAYNCMGRGREAEMVSKRMLQIA